MAFCPPRLASVTAATPDWSTPAAPVRAEWRTLSPGQPDQAPLRCWWARPAAAPPRAGVLVLPEVFGVNAWVRRVAERLAGEGYGALALPLFSRTAPELELGYDEAGLAEGRSHKERTSAAALLADIGVAAGWLQQAVARPDAGVGCLGFCFGGHVAMLAASRPEIAASVDCYGAGVVSGRPGGGPPTLDLVPTIPGRLLCLFGAADPLIPASDREAVEQALALANTARPAAMAHRWRVLEGGHGFLCDARADYHPASAAEGWREILAWFAATL